MRNDCHIEVTDLARRGVPALQKSMALREVSHVVLVQPGAHATARASLLEALQQLGACACGVTMVSPYTGACDIAQLDACGVRASQVALHGMCAAQLAAPAQQLAQQLEPLHRLLPRHWHVELSASAPCLAALAPMLAHWDRTFVAVPAGPCPDAAQGAAQSAAADSLRWWLGMGNLYFKLVCAAPTRHSAPQAMPWLDFALDSALDRVLWGSGWPQAAAVPPDRHERRGDALPLSRILDSNAADLYGFAMAARTGACP